MFLLDVKFYVRDKELLFITNNTATNIENIIFIQRFKLVVSHHMEHK